MIFIYESFCFNFHFSKITFFAQYIEFVFFFSISYFYFVAKSKSNLSLHCQDAQIEKEKQVYNITGGCTALTIVYLLGKLYVANAGDSRCVHQCVG